jgi:hypothetical protein
MEKDIYLRGIGYLPPYYYYDPKDQDKLLESIFKEGSILSRRKLGKQSNNGFGGVDYICLCDYELKDVFNEGRKRYNSYYQYICNSLSIAFKKGSIDVIKPTIIDNCTLSLDGYRCMKYLGEQLERYSDLPDEVQVKDEIPLDKMTGITFPTKTFIDLYSIRRKTKRLELLKEEINKLNELIYKYGYDVKVYDVETLNEMTEDNIERLVLKR